MIHLGSLGDPEEQASSLFKEGQELAARSADPHLLSQILLSFGFLRLATGAVTEALGPLLESLAVPTRRRTLASERVHAGVSAVPTFGTGDCSSALR
jgi:hypothetical protein